MGEIGKWVIIGVASMVGVGFVLWLFLVVTIRTGYNRGLTAIRRLNRRVTNPRVMKTAGRPGASASVIRHKGRVSGKPYETPVGVIEAGDDLLITLPYGTTADWLKNVNAEGAAEMVHDGRTFRVEHPEVVPAALVASHQTWQERFSQRLYGVDSVLRLRKSGLVGN